MVNFQEILFVNKIVGSVMCNVIDYSISGKGSIVMDLLNILLTLNRCERKIKLLVQF